MLIPLSELRLLLFSCRREDAKEDFCVFSNSSCKWPQSKRGLRLLSHQIDATPKTQCFPCFIFSETPCVLAAISAAPRDVAILSSAGTIMQLGDSLSNRHTAPQAFASTSVLAWAHTYREEILVCVCGREFGSLAVNSEMNPNSHHLTFHLSLYTHTHGQELTKELHYWLGNRALSGALRVWSVVWACVCACGYVREGVSVVCCRRFERLIWVNRHNISLRALIQNDSV